MSKTNLIVLGMWSKLNNLFLYQSYRSTIGLQPRDKAAMLGINTIEYFSPRIYVKIEFTSQGREMLLFLTTTLAAVLSRVNQQ